MNPFESLLKDVVYVENKSGDRQGPFKTNFSNGRSTIFDKTLKATSGDSLIHPLPDGSERKYTIISSKHAEGMLDIPESQTLSVDQEFTLTSPKKKQSPPPSSSNDTKSVHKMIQYLIAQVEASNESTESKIIAKLKIKELLANPIIASILGDDERPL